VKFDILLTSKSLSIDKLSDNKRVRHEIILDLHERGFSNKQISEYMNDRNIISPRGVEYYPSLIWVTLKKIKQREERLKVSDYSVGEFRFYITKIIILEY